MILERRKIYVNELHAQVEINKEEIWPVYDRSLNYVEKLKVEMEKETKGLDGEERKERILSTLARNNLKSALFPDNDSSEFEE